jgi:maltooligosyltrehalose trehalohydrolase
MSQRRRAVGAEVADGGVDVRVWAPSRRAVSVVIEGGPELALDPERDGYFRGLVRGIGAGARYRFRLDGEHETYPDPASRYQPEGPHGASEVIDPAYEWRHAHTLPGKGLVLYELHVGTFTPEGTYASAMEKLPLISDAGVNVIELMPLNEFAGAFGWGYDGVDLWAPMHVYGTPDELRRLIDAAHGHGLAVILDVVYNHLGPDGCYLAKFTPDYFTKRYANEWGDAINFDGEHAHGVRTFIAENAAYWIDEYRLDGLRIDATQSMFDASPKHILCEIADQARAAARGREIYLVGENEPQDVRMVEEDGLDAMWNDDWHHSAAVALTGHAEAYYTDYRGTPQEFISMARLGFLYQGQRYRWQKKRRGTPSHHLPPRRFVCYLQNHDQVANSARGQRIQQLTSAGAFRAMTALLLLQPQTPLLFQGQELATSKPFVYFADHPPELAREVAKGRKDFLRQFPSIAADDSMLDEPHDRATFELCKLDWAERETNGETLALHRDLIALRRSDPVFAAESNANLHGAVLGAEAFALRWLNGGDDRLLLVNLGSDLHLDPAPEPLLAPPLGARWTLLWSSESPRYGGNGTAPLETDENWRIPGRAAVVLTV